LKKQLLYKCLFIFNFKIAFQTLQEKTKTSFTESNISVINNNNERLNSNIIKLDIPTHLLYNKKANILIISVSKSIFEFNPCLMKKTENYTDN